jgi:CBS domain
MPRPLIFVSHKHNDRAIATVVRGFISEETRGTVDVFQSSDPSARTPGVGRTLNSELRNALWNAGAVILIYTSPDQDWGYCMWECGVATLPDSPDTRIILFQCADSAPSLFDGQLAVDARNKDSVLTFVTQFMTEAGFLPRASDPLTGFHKTSSEVQRAATKLFEDLRAVLPEGPATEWPAHPYLQLQLGRDSVKTIADAPAAERQTTARQVVLAAAVVSDSDKLAQALFGKAELDQRMTLQDLYTTWRAAYPKNSSAWIETLADQVGRAAQWELPTIRWAAMPALGDGHLHAPVVTRVRKIPALGTLQFDVYFYPFNLMDATPVQSRMVPREEMLCKVLGSGAERDIGVRQVLRDLDARKYSRVPLVDSDDRLVYIVHRSMLDQFVAQRAIAGNHSGLDQLTMADVFSDRPDFKAMFSGTAAFVAIDATLADARSAMEGKRNCYDVFVTDTGSAQEPILGWLTDVIIAASESNQ